MASFLFFLLRGEEATLDYCTQVPPTCLDRWTNIPPTCPSAKVRGQICGRGGAGQEVVYFGNLRSLVSENGPNVFWREGRVGEKGEGYLSISLRRQAPSFHKTGRERAREKEVDIPKDERVTPTSLNFES